MYSMEIPQLSIMAALLNLGFLFKMCTSFFVLPQGRVSLISVKQEIHLFAHTPYEK